MENCDEREIGEHSTEERAIGGKFFLRERLGEQCAEKLIGGTM